MAVRGGLTNSCEKTGCKKQRRKGKIYPFECKFQRTARRDKKAFLSDQCREIDLPFSVHGLKGGHWQISGYPDLSLPLPTRASSSLLPEGEKGNLIFCQLIYLLETKWVGRRGFLRACLECPF